MKIILRMKFEDMKDFDGTASTLPRNRFIGGLTNEEYAGIIILRTTF